MAHLATAGVSGRQRRLLGGKLLKLQPDLILQLVASTFLVLREPWCAELLFLHVMCIFLFFFFFLSVAVTGTCAKGRSLLAQFLVFFVLAVLS